MTKTLAAYVIALLSFVAIDMIWLMFVARGTYVAEMGDLLRKQPNMAAALAFYLVYAAGLCAFAILPGVKAGAVSEAMLWGAALGFVAYATYDLTALSVLQGFGAKIAIIDLVWGTVVSSVACGFTSWVVMKLGV
ncbi:MAG: DUF2177 family protein [Alphaproteobacteria bacterium]|nr:DUF2177 family protein [Alphaproteobacteria bacterium]